ncbi:MAG: hypothetical protein ACO3U1_05710, partial [Marivivens sp.]
LVGHDRAAEPSAENHDMCHDFSSSKAAQGASTKTFPKLNANNWWLVFALGQYEKARRKPAGPCVAILAKDQLGMSPSMPST